MSDRVRQRPEITTEAEVECKCLLAAVGRCPTQGRDGDRKQASLPPKRPRSRHRRQQTTAAAAKLRIVIPDSSGAVDAVTAEIHEVTGFTVQPQFGEIDHGQLILELRMPDPGHFEPRQMARLVEQASPDLEVLSTWREPAISIEPRPVQADRVLSVDDVGIPAVPKRAFDDRLPIAAWQAEGDGDVAHWLLAVPVETGVADCPVVVGTLRRDGYSYRFNAFEASALGAALAL